MSGTKVIDLDEYKKSKETVWGVGTIESNERYKKAQEILNKMWESIYTNGINSPLITGIEE